jgi:hypothetical protein
MGALPATGRTPEVARLIADAEAWNAWAETINAKALAAGLVTAEELERYRRASQAALDRLRT